MNRRSFFKSVFGVLAAPTVAKVFPLKENLPVGLISESRRFNSDGTMSFYRDEVVPCILQTNVPIHFNKLHEVEFVYKWKELSLDEFTKRYPYETGKGYFHGKECRNFEVILERDLFA